MPYRCCVVLCGKICNHAYTYKRHAKDEHANYGCGICGMPIKNVPKHCDARGSILNTSIPITLAYRDLILHRAIEGVVISSSIDCSPEKYQFVKDRRATLSSFSEAYGRAYYEHPQLQPEAILQYISSELVKKTFSDLKIGSNLPQKEVETVKLLLRVGVV
jgi:hypothetical protein